MISKLKGLIEEVGETWVDVDVQGVCYRLSCATQTLAHLPSCGEAVTLFTQMIVRENDTSLLGFQSAQERSLFHLLTSVQGVGMRAGLALISIGSPEEIAQAITRGNKAFICRAEGVGPKLASRLLNELKDKISAVIAGVPTQGGHASLSSLPEESPSQDAVAALVSLGYKATEAAVTVETVLKTASNHESVQDVIRLSLAKLARA